MDLKLTIHQPKKGPNGRQRRRRPPRRAPQVQSSPQSHGKLTVPYNVMMTFFFRRSVEKAFQLDESPSGLFLSLSRPIDSSPPFIIMAVDDVIFIVNAVIQRSVSTSQRDVIASVIPTVARVLGSDFVGMVQRKMRDESYPKPLVQGGFPPEDKIVAFIVLINSLDVANDYLTRIIVTNLGVSPDNNNNNHPSTPVSRASPLRDAFPSEPDRAFVAAAWPTCSRPSRSRPRTC